MVAPSKSKKTTKSKTKKTGAAASAKPKSKRTTKGASSSSARIRVTKSKTASNTRGARKTTKTTRAKAKTVATKLSKRKRITTSVKAVARVTAAKKAASAAARKAAAAKSVKATKTAAAAKRASAVRPHLKEQEAKLTPANRNAQEVRAVTEKASAPPAKSKPISGHSIPVPPAAAAPPPAKPAAPVVKVQAAPVVKVQKVEEAPSVAKTLKLTGQRQGFKLNEFVVYPAHGVGQIVSLEEQEVAGFKLELFVISFSKDKLTLRVPTAKVTGVGMRKISDPDTAKRSLDILTGRARVKRTMWSRRAQEYETKINSGDINAIAEVVRDLYRSEAQPEQSYSERQLYEAALDRMVREIAAVQKSSEIDALKAVEAQLQKGQSRAAKALPAPSAAGEIEEQAA
jgi:CarD family transcriptional regulator